MTLVVLGNITLGSLLTTIGATKLNYYVFLVGQTMNLAALGCWIGVTMTYIGIWFKNRETALGVSLNILSSYISKFIFSTLHPIIYNKIGALKGNFWMNFILSLISFASAILLCYLDSFAAPDEDDVKQEKFTISNIKRIPLLGWLLNGCQLTILQSFLLLDMMSPDMFQKIFGMTNEEAGFIFGFPLLILAIFGIFTGMIIYRIGYKPHTSNLRSNF